MSATYLYEAFTRAGEASNGSIESESEQDAVVALRGQGLLVTGIKESRTAGLGKTKVSFGGTKKVKLKDVAWMARNLATTQAAGLPIVRALKMLAGQRAGSAIGDTMLAVHEDVVNGGALGEAFGKQEAKLGPLTTALVEAGEMSGKLDEALHKLAELTDARVRLKRKIISALAYPGVMMVLVFLIFFAMLIFVVPAFKTMYATIDGDLPAITSVLLKSSNFIRSHVLIEVFIIAMVVIGFKQLKRTEGFRRWKDKAMLGMPVFGSLFRLTTVARLSTTLASSLSAGVPLLEALTLSSSVANNVVFSDALERARIQVRDGKSLSAALQGEKEIPEMFTQLVAIGEETGAIDELLLKYATGVEDEVETKVEGLTSTLEPLMIVVFGAVIGVMVIALLPSPHQDPELREVSVIAEHGAAVGRRGAGFGGRPADDDRSGRQTSVAHRRALVKLLAVAVFLLPVAVSSAVHATTWAPKVARCARPSRSRPRGARRSYVAWRGHGVVGSGVPRLVARGGSAVSLPHAVGRRPVSDRQRLALLLPRRRHVGDRSRVDVRRSAADRYGAAMGRRRQRVDGVAGDADTCAKPDRYIQRAVVWHGRQPGAARWSHGRRGRVGR